MTKPALLLFFLGTLLFVGTSYAQTTGCSGAGYTTIRINDTSGNSFLSVGPSTSTDKFSTQGSCVTGNRAVIPQFGIPTYDDLVSIFYTQAKSIPGKVYKNFESVGNYDQTQIPPPSGGDPQLYHIKKSTPSTTDGNLSLGGNFPGGNNVRVFFIDGNLYIKNNITQPPPKTGTVFIVGGNIYIDPAVTDIEAILLNYKEFCSGYDFINNICPASVDAQQLNIDGSILYFNSAPNSAPRFVRNNASGNNTTPSEKINYQPKYLILLKDIISRDLSVWSEL